jgi:hypothetical protein
MSTLGTTPDGAFEFDSEPYGGRASLPLGGRLFANDPRTPPPAADLNILTEPGLPPMIVSPQGQPLAQSGGEEDVPKKIGIFATKDEFAVAVLDDDNDPVEGGSYKFTADLIVQKVKPLLEAAGHKVVDQTFGSLHEAASDGKVKPMRRRASE